LLTAKTADATEVQSAIRKHPLFKHQGSKSEWSNWELAFIDQIVLEHLSEYLKEYLDKNSILNGKSLCDVIAAEAVLRGICLLGQGSGRLGRFRAAGSLCDHPSDNVPNLTGRGRCS
jgi:hypothetical protein